MAAVSPAGPEPMMITLRGMGLREVMGLFEKNVEPRCAHEKHRSSLGTPGFSDRALAQTGGGAQMISGVGLT